MAKGDVLPSESVDHQDPDSNVRIRQITSHPSLHHHPFYYIPAWDDGQQWLFFVSHRSGKPQFYAERQSTRELVQLTDRDDINEWSLHPSHDGRILYFTTTGGGWRLELESLKETQLVEFAAANQPTGMVGAGMGTTSVSHDDAWWAIPVKDNNVSQLLIVATESGECHVACDNETIGHPQFHPNDANLIRYGGPYHQRLWITERNGNNHRLVYRRNAEKKEWIVHECWRPGARQILTTNWPHGVMSVDIDTEETEWLTRFNAWHPMVNPSGTQMVADTNFPDNGLHLFSISNTPGEPQLLCQSHASSVGAHWNTDHCPYDDGPVDVYAPQHTHPHPTYSPDGRRVLYTSDRSGYPQLYEVDLSSV